MKKHNQFAFTLAEVLITLGIIGIVASLTLPALIQKHQDKELVVRTKKLYSDLSNALVLAQKDYDVIGDNSLLFNTTDSSIEVAEKLSKYLNGAKFCKNKNDNGCAQYYYDIKYATLQLNDNNQGKTEFTGSPKIILSNGAIVAVNNAKRPDCTRLEVTDKKDDYGRPLKNPDGSNQTSTWTSYSCGYLNVDVNGVRKPNQYGRDAYQFSVYKEKLILQTQASVGGKSLQNIFYGNGKLEYEKYTKGESYDK